MKTTPQKNDCDIIVDNLENTFSDLGNCLDSMVDEKQTKISVLKNFFKFGSSLTKLLFKTTTCAVKHTPKAIVTVASVKREIVNTIEHEYKEYEKQQKKEALELKISKLKSK